ncbi:MAG TPA: glutaredoxin [Gemmatimonadaceae bacterium]|nr:glutaredoxin [Gemmatimonadaceae bacterium]
MAEAVELFGGKSCQYTAEVREQLEWDREEFVEYDVETDESALRRMRELTGGGCTVPVLVRNGKVVQVGWQGRGCVVAAHVDAEHMSPPSP